MKRLCTSSPIVSSLHLTMRARHQSARVDTVNIPLVERAYFPNR